jgi:hypothetical protein
MPRLTEEEAKRLDELMTNTEPRLGPNGTGIISLREARLMGLDDLSIKYLTTKSEATNKTPAQIIGELIRKELQTA